MKCQTTALALIAAALIAGCASKPNIPPETQMAFGCPLGGKTAGSIEDLIAAKVQTAGDVKGVKVKEMRCIMQGDLLRIDATLANDATSVRRVAYRFDWIDRNGMKGWNDESWKPVYLYEKSHETIIGTAPAASAVDFRLVLLDVDKER